MQFIQEFTAIITIQYVHLNHQPYTTTKYIMAKSLRSKVKQAAGRKRRSDSHYAVAEAARIQRLSDKLLAKAEADKEAKAAEPVAEVETGDDADMKDGELWPSSQYIRV